MRGTQAVFLGGLLILVPYYYSYVMAKFREKKTGDMGTHGEDVVLIISSVMSSFCPFSQGIVPWNFFGHLVRS